VDKEILTVVGVTALIFLLMLPQWMAVGPSLVVQSASLSGDSLTFSVSYEAPWPKSCYVVVYGPFRYDNQPGHETGNNIYVLTARQGTLSDTLQLRTGETLESFSSELWCDNDLMTSAEVPL
jgi:hypothetical protein